MQKSALRSERLEKKKKLSLCANEIFPFVCFPLTTRLKCHVHPSSSPSLRAVINSTADRTADANRT